MHALLSRFFELALAEIGKRLSKQALAEVASIVTPDTIIAWHRKLVAQMFDGSAQRQTLGRPKVAAELETLIVRMAQENRSWGYDRIVGHWPTSDTLIDDAGVTRIGLPPRSPNLHAYAERWVWSVKDEALSRLILFGERSLRHVLHEYRGHEHHERTHQGKGNVSLFPLAGQGHKGEGRILCRARLGGLLKSYERAAA
jgi:hypothetical protein